MSTTKRKVLKSKPKVAKALKSKKKATNGSSNGTKSKAKKAPKSAKPKKPSKKSMVKVTYHHLKYEREERNLKVLKPLLKDLAKDNPSLQNFLHQDVAGFYHLLGNAILVDRHPNIDLIKNAILKKYDVDTQIRVFQYENYSAKAMCTNRTFFENGKKKTELIILVSQHFFNQLDFQEQISVLSHELCHFILGHIEIPGHHLLQSDIDFADHGQVKIFLMKWLLCAEISSDIFALYASNFNPKHFSSAVIKFNSGVNALNSYDMVDVLLDQYDDLTSQVRQAELTPHPILPLRIKVIDEICENSELISKMDTYVSKKELKRLTKDYNKQIDDIVIKVYPELFEDTRTRDETLYLLLGTAVVLTDHKITDEEERLLCELNKVKKNRKCHFDDLRAKCEKKGYEVVIKEKEEKALAYCRKRNYGQTEIVPVLRYMLRVASADKVQLAELRLIARFAANFDISREYIVILLHQLA